MKEVNDFGVSRLIYTDINRDGMLSGPNIEALSDFANRSKLKVVASGGVSSLKDINALKDLQVYGVDQVIIGKAIYDEELNLEEILKC